MIWYEVAYWPRQHKEIKSCHAATTSLSVLAFIGRTDSSDELEHKFRGHGRHGAGSLWLLTSITMSFLVLILTTRMDGQHDEKRYERQREYLPVVVVNPEAIQQLLPLSLSLLSYPTRLPAARQFKVIGEEG